MSAMPAVAGNRTPTLSERAPLGPVTAIIASGTDISTRPACDAEYPRANSR